MVSTRTIFWEVDVQKDFMYPRGALYVPGAEGILANVNRLVEAARQCHVLLVSSADAHNPDDPELREWPPHCLKGTPGAEIVPEGLAPRQIVVPNSAEFSLPADLNACEQITLEKNTLDVFDNPNSDKLLGRLSPAGVPPFDPDAEFLVFGVVTEYCVRCTVEGLLRRGRRATLVTDAIRSLDATAGRQLLEDWRLRGVRLVSTDQALSFVASAKAAGFGKS